jgi:hypothetical protein
MGKECSVYGEMRNVYNILLENPEEKRPLKRHRHRWEDNIKTDFMEIGLEDVARLHCITRDFMRPETQ